MCRYYHRLLLLSDHVFEKLTSASILIMVEISTQKKTLLLEFLIIPAWRQLLLRKLDGQLSIQFTELTLIKLNELAPTPLICISQHVYDDHPNSFNLGLSSTNSFTANLATNICNRHSNYVILLEKNLEKLYRCKLSQYSKTSLLT